MEMAEKNIINLGSLDLMLHAQALDAFTHIEKIPVLPKSSVHGGGVVLHIELATDSTITMNIRNSEL